MTKRHFRIHSSSNNRSNKKSRNHQNLSNESRIVRRTPWISSLVRHHHIPLDVRIKKCSHPNKEGMGFNSPPLPHSVLNCPLKSSRQLKTCKTIRNSILLSISRKNLLSFPLYSLAYIRAVRTNTNRYTPDCPSYSSPKFKNCLLCLFYRKAFPCTTPMLLGLVLTRYPRTVRDGPKWFEDTC